jgi:hypothetical protein
MNGEREPPTRLHVPPRAPALVEALRGLGYSPQGALADIVDNSISAGATEVNLEFSWQGLGSVVSVLDNGCGMTRDDLVRAMRLGDRNPLDSRAQGDLGRFGLGLKTASFSQARRLMVASKRGGVLSCCEWDLDELASSTDDGWYLQEGLSSDAQKWLQGLESWASGTAVIWRGLDRVVTAGFGEQDFLDLIDHVEQHLAMVFHRFLPPLRTGLTIRVNGRALRGWDPFLVSHPATWSSPVERLQLAGGPVEVQGHVLPHKDRLDDDSHRRAGGPGGWAAQQGFYVYRNSRLLVSGSWLGLGRDRPWTKDEAFRLARIRLDFQNAADADWKIDIRKSTARPPVVLRERLTRLAEHVRDQARRVFAHRGASIRVGGAPLLQAWQAVRGAGGIRYRVDEAHPAVSAVLEQAGGLQPQIRAMLRVIEETVPVQQIWLATTEARETPRTAFAEQPATEVLAVLEVLYRNLVFRKGLSPARAREQLKLTEPFNSHPTLIDTLPDLSASQDNPAHE